MLVTRVIDGDTIVIEGGERVRYIGIDTPEDTSTTECFGAKATARNRDLVEGRFVQLERDVSETDQFGRLLRYVWIDDVMVNEMLVAEGFALVTTFPPDVKHETDFLVSQNRARAQSLGLWAGCIGPPRTTPTALGGCDPSYPDVCIPHPPPDLDCGDISERNFRVTGSEPHRFDRGGDGVGCER